MRILIAHNRYRSGSPSGENGVVDLESAALARAGHEVARFERRSDDIAQFPLVRRALVPAQVVASPGAARDLARRLDEFRPDVVHVHNLFPLLSPAVMRACLLHRVPVVATVHNYRMICPNGALFRSGAVCHECVNGSALPAVRHGCYRGSALATVPLAVASQWHRRSWRTLPSAYVFISESQRLEFSGFGLPWSRCFVKDNCVAPMPTGPSRTTEHLVVFAGRLTEEKGVGLLMRAWDHYAAGREEPGLRLAIAGAGPLAEAVGNWAAPRPSVDWLGLQTREQCAALLGRARAAVVPSLWPEAFGLVVAEAMAAGVAPIVTAHGALPDLVTDGEDGLVFAPGDERALAAILARIDRSPHWFDALGRNAAMTYRARFRPEVTVERLEAIYRFALAHPVWLEEGAGALGPDCFDPELTGRGGG